MSLEYYNQESNRYSSKRYDGIVDTYVKYFFKRRLAIALEYILFLYPASYISDLDILEDGTADGVVLRQIGSQLAPEVGRLVGVDIAENMITRAKALSPDNYEFYVKSDTPRYKFGLVLAIGFVSPSMWHEESAFIKDHLREGGHVIMSLGSRKSLHAYFKLKGKSYVQDYLLYRECRQLLEKEFRIVKEIRYGIFVPKLWAFPVIARVVQPIVDTIFTRLIPDFSHEALYLLEMKK